MSDREEPIVNRRFLLTWKSIHIYFQSETWSMTWWGIRWQWTPEICSGMGSAGWMFHWFGILIERCCFDADDWGERKAQNLANIFRVLLKDKSSD